MARRRLIYLTALLCCVIFFWASRQWLSWLLLILIAILPWVSLLLSLPGILLCRIRLRIPRQREMGNAPEAGYVCIAPLPVSALRGKLSVTNTLTGYKKILRIGDTLPGEHCGALLLTPKRLYLTDLLGIWTLPVRKPEPKILLLRPKPIPIVPPPDTRRYLCQSYKPKAGGGFGENHELRLYRPGDNLRQIHWKLSAKTGKLIFREPMESQHGKAVITMALTGTPEALDQAFGNLLWLSRYLLRRQMEHHINCHTGNGMKDFTVTSEETLLQAVDTLLQAAPVTTDVPPHYRSSSWRYHIGGECHES